jgi:hypothetical protein
VIAWFGFAGAWLLVIGPLYQGVVELLELEIDQQGIRDAAAGTSPPPLPPTWWWLLPPVMIVLLNRRSRAYRRAAMARLTPRQRAQYRGFVQKASGWFAVATGASLLAVKETWELSEHQEWPPGVFAALLVAMFVLCIGNAAYAMSPHRARVRQRLVDG